MTNAVPVLDFYCCGDSGGCCDLCVHLLPGVQTTEYSISLQRSALLVVDAVFVYCTVEFEGATEGDYSGTWY